MIALLDGKIRDVLAGSVILDIGGVGYSVYAPHTNTLQKGASLCLYISYRFSAEQGPSLYGFHSIVERDLFNLVTSCSGFGPKIGLALFEQLSAKTIVDAVIMQDIKTLSSVSGIGAKKAELLVHSIRDKILTFAPLVVSTTQGASSSFTEIALTLETLGYSRIEINRVCQEINKLPNIAEVSFDQLLKKSLVMLSEGIKV